MSSELKIKLLTEDLYPAWDTFIEKSSDAWFWHKREYCDYLLDKYPNCQSHNFMVFQNDELVAIVPLTLTIHKNNIAEWTHAGWAIPFPAIKAEPKSKLWSLITHTIFKNIDDLSKDLNIKRIGMCISPHQRNVYKTNMGDNILYKIHGFLDCSEETLVINLNKSEEEILFSIRKRYKRYIRNLSNKIETIIIDNHQITDSTIDDFIGVAKRNVSKNIDEKDYIHLQKWLQNNDAILIQAKLIENQKAIGYLAVLNYKKSAFDYMVVVDDEHKELRVSHAMKMTSLFKLKELGTEFYELGVYTNCPKIYRLPSAKQKGITRFKSGFADKLMSLPIAEKFYDVNYFKKVYVERIEEFSEWIEQTQL